MKRPRNLLERDPVPHGGKLLPACARVDSIPLGHKSGSVTTDYSAAELRELVDAMEFIATDSVRESHAPTLLKRKAVEMPQREAK